MRADRNAVRLFHELVHTHRRQQWLVADLGESDSLQGHHGWQQRTSGPVSSYRLVPHQPRRDPEAHGCMPARSLLVNTHCFRNLMVCGVAALAAGCMSAAVTDAVVKPTITASAPKRVAA